MQRDLPPTQFAEANGIEPACDKAMGHALPKSTWTPVIDAIAGHAVRAN